MKVICIDAEMSKNTLTEGEIYTVIREGMFFTEPIYFLQGLQGPYMRKRFVPVSDIDETEFVSEEFNEKYLVPVK